jgi:sulfatase maturation enzyme AslB (radical SAM superfamily)
VTAVLHQLHPDPLFLSTDVWERIVHDVHNPEIIPKLHERGLITTEEADVTALECFRSETIRRLNRPTILYLMLAQGCNNACTYCPVPKLAVQYGNTFLSLDNAIAGLQLWRQQIVEWDDGEPFFVILYGGEPLLNKPVLEAIVSLVSGMKEEGKLPSSVRMFLPTNGRLVDESLARFLAVHDVLVTVGVDGTPAEHDVLRITDRGMPTSHETERALRVLSNNGVKPAVSLTLTPSVITRGMESVMYLKSLGVTHIGSNLLKGAPLGSILNGVAPETYARRAAEFVLAASSLVDEYQVTKRQEALAQQIPFAVDCTCSGNQIVVQSDGSLTNCPFHRISVGDVHAVNPAFRISKTTSVGKWRSRIPLMDEEGIRHEVFLSSGGCAWGMFDATGSLYTRDIVNEAFNQEVMYGILWRGLPDRERERLLHGATSHWYHRRIGAM